MFWKKQVLIDVNSLFSSKDAILTRIKSYALTQDEFVVSIEKRNHEAKIYICKKLYLFRDSFNPEFTGVILQKGEHFKIDGYFGYNPGTKVILFAIYLMLLILLGSYIAFLILPGEKVSVGNDSKIFDICFFCSPLLVLLFQWIGTLISWRKTSEIINFINQAVA